RPALDVAYAPEHVLRAGVAVPVMRRRLAVIPTARWHCCFTDLNCTITPLSAYTVLVNRWTFFGTVSPCVLSGLCPARIYPGTFVVVMWPWSGRRRIRGERRSRTQAKEGKR